MTLMLYYKGGELITKDLQYHGDSIEAAAQIDRDTERISQFMDSEDARHCTIQGFMFTRDGLRAAQISEGVI
jgi:hypothetical protein